MANEINIAIVGGGVIGCAVARELSGRYNEIFLFEKNPGITQGENQSSRNSGVIHSGIYYDQETRPQKASLCVAGNRLLYDFCSQYRVPALKTGKLMLATSREEEEVLDVYFKRAGQNNVPGVERISASKAGKLEPNIAAKSALIVPSAGIVDPGTLVYRLHTLASQEGVQFMNGTEIIGFENDEDHILIHLRYPDGRTDKVRTSAVINAAGIDADLVARLFNHRSTYELDPVRGESYKFYGNRPELDLKSMNIYPTPESIQTPNGRHFTVGIHLTPTFKDISYPPALGTTVTIGPKLVPVRDRTDRQEQSIPAKIFADKVRLFFPGIKEDDLIWHQAGLQARLKGDPDFVIVSDPVQSNFINLLGIDSPGLTSCLAIARRVGEIIDEGIE
ncbi:MAG: FAD-dependent oxidoreductase [Desulfobacterales bacterium]|nr:FAD-dependent oxidoreductase [Desulfobacterales bacterium]